MDEWCAVWFWPTDEDSLRCVPTPSTFHRPMSSQPRSSNRWQKIKVFHWELEFPDVFTPQRSGFDAVIGNPPWDVMKPNSKEFFYDYDPLYRTYDKQLAVRKQLGLFDTVLGLLDRWQEYSARFKAMSNCVRNLSSPFSSRFEPRQAR